MTSRIAMPAVSLVCQSGGKLPHSKGILHNLLLHLNFPISTIHSSMRKFLLVFIAVSVHAANWPEHPVLHAVRVTKAPVIDGDLNDPAWQQAPEFTDFTQHDPDDTKPATMRTSIRIVYDDSAIYFGAKMTDPQRPSSLLFRRDTFGNFDFLSINLDPQHDRLSGNAFTVTPANEQGDTVLYND